MVLSLLGEGAECQGHSPAIDPSPRPGWQFSGNKVHPEAHPAPSLWAHWPPPRWRSSHLPLQQVLRPPSWVKCCSPDAIVGQGRWFGLSLRTERNAFRMAGCRSCQVLGTPTLHLSLAHPDPHLPSYLLRRAVVLGTWSSPGPEGSGWRWKAMSLVWGTGSGRQGKGRRRVQPWSQEPPPPPTCSR